MVVILPTTIKLALFDNALCIMAEKEQEQSFDQGNSGENLQTASVIPENNNAGITETTENPEREITQTDHLNKRLLSAFLDRLNETGASHSDSTVEEDDPWGKEDQPGH